MLNTRRVRMPKRKDPATMRNRGKRRVGLARPSVRKYPIRYSRMRGTRHWSRRSPGTRIFFGSLLRAGTGRIIRVRAMTMPTGECWASLERGKFTVLAIKFSLSHYPDPQSARQHRGIRLSVYFHRSTRCIISL